MMRSIQYHLWCTAWSSIEILSLIIHDSGTFFVLKHWNLQKKNQRNASCVPWTVLGPSLFMGERSIPSPKLTTRTWTLMVARRYFPFGKAPGAIAVSFMEGTFFPWPSPGISGPFGGTLWIRWKFNHSKQVEKYGSFQVEHISRIIMKVLWVLSGVPPKFWLYTYFEPLLLTCKLLILKPRF